MAENLKFERNIILFLLTKVNNEKRKTDLESDSTLSKQTMEAVLFTKIFFSNFEIFKTNKYLTACVWDVLS